jgi:putative endonuclease
MVDGWDSSLRSERHFLGELKVFRFSMARETGYCVYIMASWTRTLYIGVTNNLLKRAIQHKQKEIPGFTHSYNVTRLVYFEQYSGIGLAIMREKQLKGLLRKKKISLIESTNPEWKDLSDGYIAEHLLKAAN